MRDGKKSGKRDMVILSIKPVRPDYPSTQKFVAVKQVLQDWDQLDAYYRGQLLKYGIKSADQGPLTESESTYLQSAANKLHGASTNDRSRSRSKGSTKTSKNSRSRGKHDLKELFGDENIPSRKQVNNPVLLDENNNSDNTKTQHRKTLHEHHDEKESIALDCDDKFIQNVTGDILINFLSVPREDFKVKVNLGSKQRSPLDPPVTPLKLLDPIKVNQFTPPVPIGLNSVHIQKILYHKNSYGCTPTSTPTTTTNDVSNHSSCGITSDSTSKKIGRPPDISSNGEDSYSCDKRQTTRKFKSSSSSYSCSSDDEYHHSNKLGSPMKRHSDANNSSTKMRIISPNGIPVPVSSTSEWSPSSNHSNFSSGGTTKKRIQHSTAILTRESPKEKILSESSEHSISSNQQSNTTTTTTKVFSKEQEKRQKQREVESFNRKVYALKKADEFEEMEAVQLSMKSFEMIHNCPLLSPIRSP